MKKLQSVFLVIFYLVFFYCSFNILLIRRNNYVEQQKIVNLQQELTSKSENTNIEIPLPTISPFTQFANSDISSNDSEAIEETQPKILAKYEELYSQNTDLYG